jgi:hypothetical protein
MNRVKISRTNGNKKGSTGGSFGNSKRLSVHHLEGSILVNGGEGSKERKTLEDIYTPSKKQSSN